MAIKALHRHIIVPEQLANFKRAAILGVQMFGGKYARCDLR